MAKPSGQVQISIKGLKNEKDSFKGLSDAIERYAKSIVSEEAKFAEAKAIELYSKAKYDGVNDVTVSSKKIKDGYNVTIRGNALPYIEYGTGVYGEDYNKNEFTAFGRNKESIEAGYQKRISARDEANKRVKRGEQSDIASEITAIKDYQNKYGKGYWFYTAKPGDQLNAGGQVATTRNPNGTSRITKGNKAQHILDRVTSLTRREIPKIARRMKLRYKK